LKKNKFKQYKKLKGLLDGKCYRGYPLHLVLGSYLGVMIWNPSFAFFFRCILLNIKNYKFPYSSKSIHTFSIKREDYTALILAYFPEAKMQYVGIDNNTQQRLTGVFPSIIALIRGFTFSMKIKCTFVDRLKLIIALSIAFKIIDELEKQEIQCEKYIAFNSSYFVESFLSYYFRNRGVETYSLQHGMYFNFINSTPYDVINYENVCADVLLLWGEYSQKEVTSLLPVSSSSDVFGYPDSKFPVLLESSFLNKILVLLPREIYIEKSYVLLEYLKKYELEYIVRPHPSVSLAINEVINAQENFDLDRNAVLIETLTQFKYRAVISFNSTAVFEAALFNQNVFIFATDEDEFQNPGFDEFNLNSDFMVELENQIDLIKSDLFFSKGSNIL
jgi:hypothetical protein